MALLTIRPFSKLLQRFELFALEPADELEHLHCESTQNLRSEPS